MKKSTLYLFFVLSFHFITAQNIETDLQNYLDNLVQKKQLPGITAAVSKNGKLIWAGSSGTIDMNNSQLPSKDNVYRIGSVSKVVTTALLMRMVKKGMVDLDLPIKTWLTGLPVDKQKITLRQLATHTSGIRHYNPKEILPDSSYTTAYNAVHLFINDPLQMEPGYEWSYSSYGSNLMAAVLEKAANTPFPELLKEEVFIPLKMNNSYTWGDSIDENQLVKLYDSDNQIVFDDISYKWAGGGLLSSVSDLIAFGNAHLSGNSFFSKEELQLIFQAQSTVNGIIEYQGIGWRLDKLDTGEPFYYHNGHLSGGHAHISIQPKEGIVVAVLSNKGSSFGAEEGNELVNILFDRSTSSKVVGVENEKKEFMKVFKLYNAEYTLIKNAFANKNIDEFSKCVSANFRSKSWQNKASFIEYISSLFKSGNIVIDDANADIKFDGTEPGSRIKLVDLKLSQGFSENDIIVLRYDGNEIKIITVIED